jgi:hypothetical protein
LKTLMMRNRNLNMLQTVIITALVRTEITSKVTIDMVVQHFHYWYYM